MIIISHEERSLSSIELSRTSPMFHVSLCAYLIVLIASLGCEVDLQEERDLTTSEEDQSRSDSSERDEGIENQPDRSELQDTSVDMEERAGEERAGEDMDQVIDTDMSPPADMMIPPPRAPNPELIIGSCAQACDVYGSELVDVPWRDVDVARQLRDHLLRPVDMPPRSTLGADVALSDQLAVVSVSERASNASAWVFSRGPSGAWTRRGRISASGDIDKGLPVAIQGDQIFMGVSDRMVNNSHDNSVYVFQHTGDGLIQSQRIRSEGAQATLPGYGNSFGSTLDVSDRQLIIGAKYEDHLGAESGGVYLYQRGQSDGRWVFTQRIEAMDGGPNENFGLSVAIQGDVALVSAKRYEDETFIYREGLVYVFGYDSTTSSWRQEQILTSSAPRDRDGFGSNVELDGGTAVISARRFDHPERGQISAVFIMRREADGSWSEHQRIDPPLEDNISTFGDDIALEGDVLLVSATHDVEEELQHIIYVYTRAASQGGEHRWGLSHRLTTDARGRGLKVSAPLAISSGRILASARGRTDVYGVHGTALILEAQSPQCNPDDSCLCLEGAAGPSCADRPQMGDGALQDAERCDDANRVDGDGCSAFGELELWYQCVGAPSVCQSSCIAEDLAPDAYLIYAELSECVYIEDNCDAAGARSRIDIVCQDGVATEITETRELCPTNPACLPIACTRDAECAEDTMCLCPWGGRDQDTERSCDHLQLSPMNCLPCDQFDGPICAFTGGLPERGRTLNSTCDALEFEYILPGSCPPECSEERPCPGAFDFCRDGRCESREP